MKKFVLVLSLFFIFTNTEYSIAQETAGFGKLTLRNLTNKYSDADISNVVKLRLNSTRTDQNVSASLKMFSEVNGRNSLIEIFGTDYSCDNNSAIFSHLSSKCKVNAVDFSNYPQDDYKPWETRRHFGLALGEELFFNIFVPWALARYGRTWDSTSEERWPFIGFQSIWNNLNNGWNYDGDNFKTNYFAHPYGGNIFYNSGRSNGYNFWESTAFALAGSYTWETFMETNQPAINDWVNTGLNGAAFGEVLYRVSTLITDNEARGGHRVWTEIAAGIINPVRLFTRILSGEVSKVFPNPKWRTPKYLELKFDAGTRVLREEISDNKELEGLFDLTLRYGNPYQNKNSDPFSYFFFNFGIGSSSGITTMNALGSLFVIELLNKKKAKHNLETSLEYHYLDNPGFLYGSATICEQLNSYYKMGKGWTFRTKFGAKVIPMGGTPDDYFIDSIDGRSYDMGQGLGAIGFLRIHKGGWNLLEIQYDCDFIWTESEPSFSKHLLQRGFILLQLPVTEYFVFGVSAGYYKRNSYYNYPAGFFELPTSNVIYESPIIKVFFRTRVI